MTGLGTIWLTAQPSYGRPPAGGGGALDAVGGDDEPFARRVLRVAGREHEGRVVGLFQHDARTLRGQNEHVVDPVPERAGLRLQGDGVSDLHLVEVAEGREVRGAVAGDAHAAGV